jgi:tRNA nucleotidyltransferase/poly(A) polymerase
VWSEEVAFLFKIFNERRDYIRLVGGCVRDFLLNKKINDYDFATKYTPAEVIKILEKNNIKHYDIGIKYGTVTTIMDNKKFEITTLRSDINQKGRDTDVEFVKEYEIDAKRRDFTFNALYMDNDKKIYDYFGGIGDLKKGIIRFIGDPKDRILEDNLRILRFFRFFCYNSYCFDFKSLEACKSYSYLIINLSIERISQEFFKILNANYPVKTLKIMNKYGVLKNILTNCENMDFGGLEIFYSLKKYLDFEYNHMFVLALILSKNRDIRCNLNFKREEKQFLLLVEKYKLNSIGELNTKLPKDNKQLAKSIVLIYLCNNFKNFDEIMSVSRLWL